MENNRIDRIIDLSHKFYEMGQALIKEGTEKNDFSITQSGNIIVLLSSIILSEKDLYNFSNLCLLYTSKQILDELEKSNLIKGRADGISIVDFLKKLKSKDKDKE